MELALALVADEDGARAKAAALEVGVGAQNAAAAHLVQLVHHVPHPAGATGQSQPSHCMMTSSRATASRATAKDAAQLCQTHIEFTQLAQCDCRQKSHAIHSSQPFLVNSVQPLSLIAHGPQASNMEGPGPVCQRAQVALAGPAARP